MNARRIALVARNLNGLTGRTAIVAEHARRFASLGWDVHVFGHRIDRARFAPPVVVHRVPCLGGGSYRNRCLFSWVCERMIRGTRFDLIGGHGDTLRQDVLHMHVCVHAQHRALHGAELSPDDAAGRFHARMLGGTGHRSVVVNSNLMKDELVARFVIAAKRVAVIYPGYDPDRFKPGSDPAAREALRARLGAGRGDCLIGLITSGDFANRGVKVLLEALGGLEATERGSLKVAVIGKESRPEEYRAAAAAAGIGERVLFLPPRPDVERYYQALDLYVHPAHFETFGMSVLEAIACGLPVVTSRVAGVAELLSGFPREFLLDRIDAGELRDKLRAFLKDAGLRRRWSEEARAQCRPFTWELNARRHAEHYEALLQRSDEG